MRTGADFRHTIRRGSKGTQPTLVAYVLPRSSIPGTGGPTSVGFVVSKAVGTAVDRNRVKRVIREQFRRLRPQLPPVDLVVRLAVKPGPLDGKALAGDFLALLEKLQRPRPPREER